MLNLKRTRSTVESWEIRAENDLPGLGRGAGERLRDRDRDLDRFRRGERERLRR